MIWTLATPGYSIALSPSSTRSTLTPYAGDGPVGHQLVEGGKDVRAVVDLDRRAVELDQVEAVDAEPLTAAVHPAPERLRVVVRGQLGHAPAHLRGDDEALAGARAKEPADEALTPAVAVDVGRVDEGDAGVGRGVERPEADLVVHLAPRPADRPGTEPDRAHPVTGLPEPAVFHRLPPCAGATHVLRT